MKDLVNDIRKGFVSIHPSDLPVRALPVRVHSHLLPKSWGQSWGRNHPEEGYPPDKDEAPKRVMVSRSAPPTTLAGLSDPAAQMRDAIDGALTHLRDMERIESYSVDTP